MDTQQLWSLIDEARAQVDDPTDGFAVAEAATTLLAGYPPDDILTAEELLWELMADSYRAPLWAAAYLINGGCSDDGFDYFRGWLVTQGKETFDQAVADPDSLAGMPAIRTAAENGADIEGEAAVSLPHRAYLVATGEEPPPGRSHRMPGLDPDWDFDFDDYAELSRRLPRLAALYPN